MQIVNIIPKILELMQSFLKKGLYVLFFLFLVSCGGDHRNGTFTIGVDVAWFGIDFMGQQNNVTGFSRDLLKEIGKQKKMKLAFLPVNWDVLLSDMQAGRYNGCLSSLYPYIFNQANFDFSHTYLLTGPVLVLPESSKAKSLDQLSGKEIAYLVNSDGDLLLEKNPAILIRPYDNIPQALNDVVAGVIDGAVVNVLIASSYCQNIYAGELKIATPPMNDIGLRLLTPVHKDPQLIRAFNEGLEELKHSGTYDALLKKWSLGQGPSKR